MHPNEDPKQVTNPALSACLSQKLTASVLHPRPDPQKKSILKPSGSITKPKSKVSWGKLSVKIQLPSPDEDHSKSLEDGKSAREKYYTIGIDEREEYKQIHMTQNLPESDMNIIKRPQISLTQFLETNPAFQVPKQSPQKIEEAKASSVLAGYIVPNPVSVAVQLIPPPPMEAEPKSSEIIAQQKSESSSTESKEEAPSAITPDIPLTPAAAQPKVHFEEEATISQQNSTVISNSNKLAHSILKCKSNPLEEAEKLKMKVTATKEDEVLMTPVSKASRFRYVKSPGDIIKITGLEPIPQEDIEPVHVASVGKHLKDAMSEQNSGMKKYLEERLLHLGNIVKTMKKCKGRILEKKSKLDLLINGTMENNKGISFSDTELTKLKALVCQNTSYMDAINYYTFSLKKFGWHIPIKSPFIHFPYLDFTLTPYSTLCRISLSKKEIINSDVSNVGAILSRDNRY